MRELPTEEELANIDRLTKENFEYYKQNLQNLGEDACDCCNGRGSFAFMDGIPCSPYACYGCNGTKKKRSK